MAKKDVVVKANKIRNWHKLGKYAKLTVFLLLLLLIIIYIVLRILFDDGSFIVSLDKNEMLYSGLAMYESLNDPTPKRRLVAEDLQFMDNISNGYLLISLNMKGHIMVKIILLIHFTWKIRDRWY